MIMFSFDSSRIFSTSVRLILSSLITLDINILAEAVPICRSKILGKLYKSGICGDIFIDIVF
jgi:hypothetical protein